MVKGLDRSAYEVIAIFPDEGELGRMLRAERVLCVPMPAVSARFTWRPGQLWRAFASLTRAILSLRRTLATIDPDIVHANTLRAGIVVSASSIGTGRKVVWHIHDKLPHHPLSMLIRIAALLLRPARVMAVSDSAAKAFRGPFTFRGRVSTIHNGIDLSRFPPKGAGGQALRGPLGVPADSFLICAVGQICERKGLIELVAAFEQACAQAPHMHLVIAGDVVFEHERGYFNTLRLAASAPQIAGKVHFAGHVSDVSGLLQAADLLVLNSHEEPFGLVLVEAMSSGTPVLATRVGGIPEIVTDQENGWLVEKADTAGLAKKLVELSQSKALLEKTAQQAQSVTCPQFSLERFHSRLQGFYAELMPHPSQFIGRAESVSHGQS
jgi:L-malate glycosyltransferase